MTMEVEINQSTSFTDMMVDKLKEYGEDGQATLFIEGQPKGYGVYGPVYVGADFVEFSTAANGGGKLMHVPFTRIQSFLL